MLQNCEPLSDVIKSNNALADFLLEMLECPYPSTGALSIHSESAEKSYQTKIVCKNFSSFARIGSSIIKLSYSSSLRLLRQLCRYNRGTHIIGNKNPQERNA
jgi:hypothetical protein